MSDGARGHSYELRLPRGVRQLEFELNNMLMVLLGNVELAEAHLPRPSPPPVSPSPTPGAAFSPLAGAGIGDAAGNLCDIRKAAERVLELTRLLAQAARAGEDAAQGWRSPGEAGMGTGARVRFLPE